VPATRQNAVRADSTPHSDTQASAALACFVAVEVVAFPSLLWWGRGGWFTFDDWDLLSKRTAGSLNEPSTANSRTSSRVLMAASLMVPASPST
jgi:hypothetical protein